MEQSGEYEKYVQELARDALSKFEAVCESARSAIERHSNIGADNLAPTDLERMLRARSNLDRISAELYRGYLALLKEPAIAKVVAEDEDGKRRTYYICRGTPIGGLASYHSPIGSLAAQPIGGTIDLPNGDCLEVVERTLVFPRNDREGWDSVNSIAEWEGAGPLTIESFRRVLAREGAPDQLEALLQEEEQAANVFAGIRRSVIEKMSLRDQPVLDQYQDKIFRLPLGSALLLIGPPGTGKTTTLIRRLGQKVQVEYLDEEEMASVKAVGSDLIPHEKSWLMFTPTELLKQYLKEAFAVEGIPAPDTCIRTWSDYQRTLARNTLGLLRSASNRGSFILREAVECTTELAEEKSLEWAEEFDRWQVARFLADMRDAANVLTGAKNAPAVDVGKRAASVLDDERTISQAIAGLVGLDAQAREVRDRARQAAASSLDGALRKELGADREFLDKLASFISEQERLPAQPEDGDDDEVEEDDPEPVHTPRAAAKLAYERALRDLARALAEKRTVRKGRRNAKVLEWLGTRRPNDDELLRVSADLAIQRSASRLVNPVRRYFDGMARRYRAFRRGGEEGRPRWYMSEALASADDITPLELDVLILCSLRAANELLARPGMASRLTEPAWSGLARFRELYRNQVLVDEAPDFSPVQIACMHAVVNPAVRSFFACGDFNQRLTTWGARSIESITPVLPGVEIREIDVAYRQSKQLNDLAQDMIRLFSGSPKTVQLPQRVNNEGVPPALMEGSKVLSEQVSWLGKRVREIERFVGRLPSIAVFVSGPSDVEPFAAALNDELADINAQAIPCVGGRAIGQDNDVRVFDIQHIKGLEFEAVFFIGVDRIAEANPRLFDRYLYVGVTRAATYLGVTCDGVLPKTLEPIRSRFVDGWEKPGSR